MGGVLCVAGDGVVCLCRHVRCCEVMVDAVCAQMMGQQ